MKRTMCKKESLGESLVKLWDDEHTWVKSKMETLCKKIPSAPKLYPALEKNEESSESFCRKVWLLGHEEAVGPMENYQKISLGLGVRSLGFGTWGLKKNVVSLGKMICARRVSGCRVSG